MIKNMFKRTWLSITRKPSKSIVLLIIMFVMANLVLASLSIKNAVEESTRYAKETIGSTVFLSTDMSSVTGGMEDAREQKASGQMDRTEMMSQMSRASATVKIVEALATSEYIRDYTYAINNTASEVDFEAVEDESSSSDTKFNSPMGNRPGSMDTSNEGSIRIEGINSYAFISEVEDKTMTIYEGDYFDETTDNGVMISYELSLYNDLYVGDTITLSNIDSDEEYTLDIIGVFSTTSSGYENSIYMNIETASNFIREASYNDGDFYVTSVEFYLNDPDKSEDFINQAEELYSGLEELGLILEIDNDAYETMAGPIEQVGGFADTILLVVVGAAVAIIVLIINNNVKDRTYEMGVLISLGATKLNILSQIFFEIIIIASIGFVMSIGTSGYLAETMSSSMLADQLAIEEEASESNFNRPTGNNQNSSRPGMTATTETQVETIDTIDISVSFENYVILFLIGYAVSFIAMIIPIINIVKYEPKTILTGRG